MTPHPRGMGTPIGRRSPTLVLFWALSRVALGSSEDPLLVLGESYVEILTPNPYFYVYEFKSTILQSRQALKL